MAGDFENGLEYCHTPSKMKGRLQEYYQNPILQIGGIVERIIGNFLN